MASLIPEDLTSPGTHALVIGVSFYPHLAGGTDPTPEGEASYLEQLTSAASSAADFAAWLVNDYHNQGRELKSLRVLLSPAPEEQMHPTIQALLPAQHAATRQAVEQDLISFCAACASHRENIAFVYVAGHGVQTTKHGSVLLLQDFGGPGHLNHLHGAIDMAAVHAGMNYPLTAQTQFWFIDTCRHPPAIARHFETLRGALALDERTGDAEASPLFLAATTGGAAYGQPGGKSLFNQALMWALRDGGAAEGPRGLNPSWRVTVTQLIKVLPEKVKQLAATFGEIQSVDVAGKVHEAVLHTYPQIPTVDLHVTLNPEDAKQKSQADLALGDGSVVVANNDEWPLVRNIEAGLYLLSIQASAPYLSKTAILDVTPPEFNQSFDMA